MPGVTSEIKSETIEYELTREANIFYQLKTKVSKLSATDQDHIEKTVKNLVGNMKQYQNADVKHVGRELEKKIQGESWHKELAEKHKEATELAKAKLGTKSIEEFTKLLELNPYKISATRNAEILKNIDNAREFLESKAGKTNNELLKIYKIHVNAENIEAGLLKECRKYNYSLVKQQLKAIDNGKFVKLGDKEFSCKKEYLEHLNEHGRHEFLPRAQIKAALNQIKRHELEMQKTHEMLGPSI